MSEYSQAVSQNDRIDTFVANAVHQCVNAMIGVYDDFNAEDLRDQVTDLLNDFVYHVYSENQQIIDDHNTEEARAHERSESLMSIFI